MNAKPKTRQRSSIKGKKPETIKKEMKKKQIELTPPAHYISIKIKKDKLVLFKAGFSPPPRTRIRP